MKKRKLHNFLLFWFSQGVSQLGSVMTEFALSLWVYRRTGSAMSLSMMVFASYVPYILGSTVAGAFVDGHSKKQILLVSDGIAALCTAVLWISVSAGRFQILELYLINAIIGATQAFQVPAEDVAIGMMVPKEEYQRTSGLSSFSESLTGVLKPILATFLFLTFGIEVIFLVDLLSFFFAFCVLLFGIQLEERIQVEKKEGKEAKREGIFAGFRDGMEFLSHEKGLLYLMLMMALLNFFSRLTYENILTPMLIERSGKESVVGVVTGVIGVGGIIGGLLVSTLKKKRNPIIMVFGSAMISFLGGDLLMALGRNEIVWCIAGLAATVPIPFLMAGQKVLLYEKIPESMQGRVFAVRNVIQFGTIPVGILIGGGLAEYVFEPFMASGNVVSRLLSCLVGSGSGSGMAVMFLGTCFFGSIFSLLGIFSKEIRKLTRP